MDQPEIAERITTAIEQLQLNLQQIQARDQLNADRTVTHKRVQRAIGTVAKTDGLLPNNVRKWLREMDASRRDLDAQATVEVAAATTMGRLRISLEDFLEQHVQNRNLVPWADIEAHVRDTFLGPDEAEHLRSLMDEIRQGDFESEDVYLARFLDAAQEAYPPPRADLVHNLLIDKVVKGLVNPDVALELLTQHRPATIDDAVNAIKRRVEAEKRFNRLRPAQVSAIITAQPPTKPADQPPSSYTALEGAVAALAKDVSRLSSKFGEFAKKNTPIEPQAAQDVPMAAPATQPHGTPSVVVYTGPQQFGRGRGRRGRGRGRGGNWTPTRGACFVCGQLDHYARECPFHQGQVAAVGRQVHTNPFLQGNFQGAVSHVAGPSAPQ